MSNNFLFFFMKKNKKLKKEYINNIIKLNMSSNYNMNNIKYCKSSGLTLLMGDVDVNTSPRDGIHLPSTVTNKSNVIVNASQFVSLNKALLKVPVTEYPIHLYDQLGNIVSRMEVKRKSNVGGSLRVHSEPQTLFSHMVIPTLTDGSTTYLILQEYPHLNSVSSEKNQSQLLMQDIKNLNDKTPSLKDVVLVIAKTLHDQFLKLYPTYTDFFQVHPVKDDKVFDYVAEHLCGRVISGSKPTFQGFLEFGTYANILQCTSDNSSLVYTIRSNGRVQINTDQERTSGKFLILLESLPIFPYTFKEETTNTSFTVTKDMTIKPETFSSLNFCYILAMMEHSKFGTNFNAQFNQEKLSKLLEVPENHSKMLNYLFVKPLSVSEDVKLSEYEKLIVKTYDSTFDKIKSSLSTKIYDQTDGYAVAPPPRYAPAQMGRVASQAVEYNSTYHSSSAY